MEGEQNFLDIEDEYSDDAKWPYPPFSVDTHNTVGATQVVDAGDTGDGSDIDKAIIERGLETFAKYYLLKKQFSDFRNYPLMRRHVYDQLWPLEDAIRFLNANPELLLEGDDRWHIISVIASTLRDEAAALGHRRLPAVTTFEKVDKTTYQDDGTTY